MTILDPLLIPSKMRRYLPLEKPFPKMLVPTMRPVTSPRRTFCSNAVADLHLQKRDQITSNVNRNGGINFTLR
jgi:hypothetical protein